MIAGAHDPETGRPHAAVQSHCEGEQQHAEDDEVHLLNPSVGPSFERAYGFCYRAVLAATELLLDKKRRGEQHRADDPGNGAQRQPCGPIMSSADRCRRGSRII